MLTEAVYIKALGAICVISGCTGTGLSVSRSYGKRSRQLHGLHEMIVLLKGEIRYACSELPEAFEHVADRCEQPFAEFLTALAGEMRRMDGRSLADLWLAGIDSSLSCTCLTRGDRESLGRLGGQLGFLDREMQLAAIDLYKSELELAMTAAGQTMAQKQKLSLCLGVLSGLFLTLTLI